MAAVKIVKFLGEAPKISPELIPDAAAQVTVNAKLYSGDLLPYRTPTIIDNTGRNGIIRTLYALHDPVTDQLKWCTWLTDVDIVIGSSSTDNEQRFYYTGDGAPKVSTYRLATSLGAPFPNDYYDLGLQLPTGILSSTAASAPSATTASYSRDTGNTATIVTGTPHGLRSGNVASITGFTSTVGKTFNATNADITVINDTTISYFCPGDPVSSTADTTGKVTMAGNTIPRSYVYTWITPWGEESIASSPSDNLYIKDGQTVTVGSIPTVPPSGKNFIRGVKLYRTLASASDTAFYHLATLWFPAQITKVKRLSGVSTITITDHHNLAVGDRFKISGCTDSSFDVTGGIVTEVIDDMTFQFGQSASDVAETIVSAGSMYHDVAELSTKPAVYWGSGSYDFVDDFDSNNLFDILGTDDYDPPPEGLRGIIAAQNSIFVGFVGNKIYFSEPGLPHAWPEKYAVTLESNIVGLASVMGYILVMTEDYPYQMSGNNPATIVYARIDTPYPCLSKRSIVNMGYGAAYATHGGIAVYSPSGGMDLVTKLVHDWDTWDDALDPTTIVAKFYNGKYFASHDKGAFVFERDERIGGFFVQTIYKFTAAWLDPQTNNFYYIGDVKGNVYQWDKPDQPLSPIEWKSKVIVTKDYMNIGAARVVADYAAPSDEIDIINAYNATIPPYNQVIWAANIQLGPVNGPSDHMDGATKITPSGAFNAMMINGDPQTKYPLPLPSALPVTFRIWANKKLIFQGVLYSSDIFRLPSGYRSDTFEVAVSGSARIRAIHIGETPYGLRAA